MTMRLDYVSLGTMMSRRERRKYYERGMRIMGKATNSTSND
jgi:hypothetical protein